MTYVFLLNHFVTCCTFLQCLFSFSEKENYLQDSRGKRLLVSEKNNSRLFSAESPVYSYIPVEVHDFFYKGMHQVIKRGIIPAFYNGPQACEGGYSSFL